MRTKLDMLASLTNKYRGRKYQVVNEYLTGLPPDEIFEIDTCEGYDPDGVPCFGFVPSGNPFGAIESWLLDETFMKEVK